MICAAGFACFQAFLTNLCLIQSGIFIYTPRRGSVWRLHVTYCGATYCISYHHLSNLLARLRLYQEGEAHASDVFTLSLMPWITV